MPNLKPDPAAETHRHQPFRAFNLLSVRVNADGAPDETGDPAGETAVATADIQHLGMPEWSVPHERSHFQAFGISSNSVHDAHPFGIQ